MLRRPPRSTLFPSPTLFRSRPAGRQRGPGTQQRRAGAQREGLQHRLVVLLLVADDHGEVEGVAAVLLVAAQPIEPRSEEHTSELQSRQYLVCRLLLEKKTTA